MISRVCKKTTIFQVFDKKTSKTRLSKLLKIRSLLFVNDCFKSKNNAVFGVFLQRLSIKEFTIVFIILSIISFSACDYTASNKKPPAISDGNETSSAAKKRKDDAIVPNFEEEYLSIQSIIDKGMIAFAYIDYQRDMIKIAIPAYSDSDPINVKTSFKASTLFIDIEVPESTEDFTHTAYINVDVEDVSQYENYEINISNNTQNLSTKIIENNNFHSTPADGQSSTAEFMTETYDVPQHFYDYFSEDSLILIFPDESLNQIEIMGLKYYASDINSITLDTSDTYLYVNIDEKINYNAPVNDPRINIITINNLSSQLNKKGKIKVIRRAKHRKTISRSPNKNIELYDDEK